MTTESDRCTSCGGPRNHFVDGVLRPKCADCNDRKSSSVFRSNKTVRDVIVTPEANDLLRQIDELLEDERYLFAEDTLTGIRTTVERRGVCTEAQKRAVDNIEGSKLKRR